MLGILDKLKKYIIMVVSQGNNEWSPPESIHSAPIIFAQNELNDIFVSYPSCQMQNSKPFFRFLTNIDQLIL